MKAARLLGAQEDELAAQFARQNDGGSTPDSNANQKKGGLRTSGGGQGRTAPGSALESKGIAHNIDLSDVALAPDEGPPPGSLRNNRYDPSSVNFMRNDNGNAEGSGRASPGFLTPNRSRIINPFEGPVGNFNHSSSPSNISPATNFVGLDNGASHPYARTHISPSLDAAKTVIPDDTGTRPSSGPTNAISSVDPPLNRPEKRQEAISPFLFQENGQTAPAHSVASPRLANDTHRASAISGRSSNAAIASRGGSVYGGPPGAIASSTVPQGHTASLHERASTSTSATRLGSAGSSSVGASQQLHGSTSMMDFGSSPRARNAALMATPSSPTQQYYSQSYMSSRSSSGAASAQQGKDKRSVLSFFRKKPDAGQKNLTANANTPQLHTSSSRGNLQQASALGLDENGVSEGPEIKKKRLMRATRADKESGKGRSAALQNDHRASTGATFSSPFASGRSQPPTSLAFDLNIENINDFVDVSKRKTSLVGPKDERLSISEAAQQRRPSASGSSSHGSIRAANIDGYVDTGSAQKRRASLSLATQNAIDSPSAERPSTLKRMATASGNSFSPGASVRSGASSATAGAAADSSKVMDGRDGSPRFAEGLTSVSLAQDFSPSPTRHPQLSRDELDHANQPYMDHLRQERKGSHASTASRNTVASDVSPTTSLSNLNRSSNSKRWPGGSRPTSARPATGDDQMRKADPLSSKTPRSDWSAPDSWAVQPSQGKLQDFLRDADEDGQEETDDTQSDVQRPSDEEEANQSAPSGPLGSPMLARLEKGRPSMTASMLSGVTSDSGAFSSERSDSIATASGARDFRLDRRGTIDSLLSGPGPDRAVSHGRTDEPEDIPSSEVLANPPSSVPTGRSAQRTSMAAAAGRFAMHLPSRHRPTSRSGTADKVGSRPSMAAPAAGDESALTSRSYIKKSHPTGTAAKNTFIRIWRDDGTHSVTQIPYTHTTADLRVILARKFGDSTGACNLYVRDKGSERPLGESERPAQLQRRRLEQAGYKDSDSLDELGREDMSFLIKFVFRPDRTPYLDPNAFGNTEADFTRLDLRKSNLEMVPIFVYRHAEWIKLLDLSGNPMRDIPSDFVQLCTNLSTLCLSQLSLKRIPQSIKQAKRLTHLDISDNRIADLWHIDLSEIPQLMSLKVHNNRLHELPPYFERMQRLRDLNISNNRFDAFPVVVCKSGALSQFDASFNTISVLPPEIAELQHLQRLVLVGNNIAELPSCMESLVNLQTIDVRRNLLVNAAVLFTLPKLEVLQCQHNVIKQLDVTIGASLRTLEIGKNPLSRAVLRADDMSALTTLDLSSADISKLDDKVLGKLPKLTELVLNNNNMLALPENLGSLTQLRRLSCTHNVLASLPETIGSLINLVELQVQDNNLKSLPASIWMCGKLETINVSSNVLESFPSAPAYSAPTAMPDNSAGNILPTSANGASITESRKTSASSLSITGHIAQANMRQALPLVSTLMKLRLADNRLTEDIFEVVSQMTELRILNLSYNGIYELPNYGLRKLVKLRELYLSGNTIGSIPADELPLMSDLRTLHLNGNKLQTLPAELGQVKQLVNLDVGSNHLKYNISNQQYDWNWNSNPNLRSLNLSGNKRLEIKSNPIFLSGPDQASGMKRTDSSDFQRLTDLRLLGLMDVTVTLHQMPDEFHDRRVRTSLSQINQMSYGISDALGQHDHLSIIDVVVPRFRKLDNECLFGLFSGRGHSDRSSSRIAYHLAQWVNYRVQHEVERSNKSTGETSALDLTKVPDILRRAFLRMQKEYADMLLAEHSRRIDKSAAAESLIAAQWRCGAASVLAYVVDRTLFVANVGDALAVISRNGDPVSVTTKHDPFDREETLRIRSAEGWVSLHGKVNDSLLDVSRGFGYYNFEPVVNAEPAVSCTTLTDSDEFVILANNTLWDFIPHQTAVDIARMEREDPMLAAQKLRDYAISYGAEGSIMVMVVTLGDLFAKARLRANNGITSPIRLNDSLAFEQPYDGFYSGRTRRGREDLPIDRTLARLQREVAPPIGQVALVFTDIRNSTALWETNNGMPSAWRQHNTLVRRQLRSIGGYEVKNEGDAFMLSFQSVTSALYFCFQVQIGLLKENWPQDIVESEEGKEVYDEASGELIYRGLSVRMGIHWGSPVCEADPITRRMDYFGPMVNRAARISSAADGGQIFASRDVVSELRAIMGSVEGDIKRRNQLGGDVKGEVDEQLESLVEVPVDEDEEEYRLLHANESRDVVLLRRMGFAISELGERSLKGLETPELLNLVYPKSLSPRFTKFLETLEAPRREGQPKTPGAQATPRVEGGDPLAEAGRQLKKHKPAVQVFEPTANVLNVEDVKSLGYICLRLEALAQGEVHESVRECIMPDVEVDATPQTSLDTQSLTHIPKTRRTSNRNVSLLPPPSSRQMAIETLLHDHPELLLSGMRDEATDDELQAVLQELSGRINLALSSLALRRYVTSQRPMQSSGAFGTDLIDIIDMLQNI